MHAAALAAADEACGTWLAHTAATRAATDRATAELAARSIDTDTSDDTVTAAEWLAAHRAAKTAVATEAPEPGGVVPAPTATEADPAEVEPGEVTDETDFTDVSAQRAADLAAAAEDARNNSPGRHTTDQTAAQEHDQVAGCDAITIGAGGS